MDDLFRHVALTGYDGTAVIIYADSRELFRAVLEGDTQLILEGTYIVLCAASKLKGETLLINAKENKALFQALFVVLDSSPLFSAEDLIGKTLALEDDESTSGYFAPMVALRNRGLIFDKSETLKDNAVNIYLAGEDEIILRDLFAGTADCGVIPDYEWDELEPDVRNGLRVLFRSESFPRSLLLLSPELNDADRESLASYFLSMNEGNEGSPILNELKSGGFFKVGDVYSQVELDELTGLCDELNW